MPPGDTGGPRQPQCSVPWWQEVAVAGCPLWDPPQEGPPVLGSPCCLCQSALAPFPALAKMEVPELLRLWVLAAMALGVSQATLPDHHVLPDHRISSETGTIFVHELERELFQEAFPAGSEDDDAPITFQAHLRDHPDLPRWLRYLQRDPCQPGYLYGCPTASEVGTHTIEVGAHPHTPCFWGGTGRGDIFRGVPCPCRCWPTTAAPTPRCPSASSSPSSLPQVRAGHPKVAPGYPTGWPRGFPMGAACRPTGGDPPYQGEFLVGNRNVEELLPEAAREMFLQGSAGVWERGDLQVINVTSTLDRGGRVPLPIEGRKEGVYVKVGSHSPFSPCLESAVSPQSRFRCSLGQQPLASCYDTFAPHFSIRWCNLTLLRVWPSPTTPGPVWGSGVLEEDGDFQPPTEVPPQDLLPGFLVTLLVPLVVAALLCLLLGHLMCCRREGVQKRDLQTSDIQLVHHTTIHGDTEELRHMAGSRDVIRDVPRPLSTLPMFNVRTGQRINPMPSPRDGARVPLLPQ
ncbi:PREDICTED: alpha-sarcoglycan isoform X2 [Lepidothrix coronata]|uniref:Alpha-sarcoglycan isoform X2 n=1 Tax=Lepidothrix coronata TaxID=321398 RepID=A0A6J0J5J4_9PASS|nr:PREDICTED: alpha-sarcoglycan isoform X2 [Lepidothrix coronata]